MLNFLLTRQQRVLQYSSELKVHGRVFSNHILEVCSVVSRDMITGFLIYHLYQFLHQWDSHYSITLLDSGHN